MAPIDKKDNNDAVELTAETDKKTVNDDDKKKKSSNKKSSKTSKEGDIIDDENTLSEEDQELKERLETCVSTLLNKKNETEVTIPIRINSLNIIVKELREATSSMTSVPKPLKFLRPYFDELKEYYNNNNSFGTSKKSETTTMDVDDELDNETLELKARLADVLSVLAMTMGNRDERESLKFKLKGLKDYELLQKRGISQQDNDNLGSWGHEFVRSLAGEIGQEYNIRTTKEKKETTKKEDDKEKKDEKKEEGEEETDDDDVTDLLNMVDIIVPFHVTHNAEAEAIDLLIEVQRLKETLVKFIDTIINKHNYERICLYLIKTANYMSDPEDIDEMLDTAYTIYKHQHQYYDALRLALRMGDTKCHESIPDLFKSCSIAAATTDDDDKKKNDEKKDGDENEKNTDENKNKFVLMKKQMCLLLGRHKYNYEVSSDDVFEDAGESEEELNELIGNEKLSEQFLKLGQDLDVMDAKTPEDIYKSHLAETGGFSRRARGGAGDTQVDSARANLASTFVNAFVNAGFGQDKLMTPDNEWLYKNKDHGMMSAAASLGSILLWNVDEGLTQIDKFLYSSEDYVKAGAALAVGILSSGVRNDADPALALLSEHVEGDVHVMKVAACTGLGIAYAGSAREDVAELLVPVIESSSADSGNEATTASTMLEVSLAGLALGMVYVGKCDEEVGSTIVQRLMEATDDELSHSHARYLCIGLGLLFLGQLEKADAMIEALRTIEHKISKYALLVLETFAYAGSGNVLKVQEMLHQCAEHLTEDAEHQMAAVIGLGLITMGEDVGSEMALRTFDHLLHYCEPPVKRAVPLALAVLHISDPDFSVIDQLSRLSHDPDTELSQNAIIALGVVSAGTNNSRVAGLLRQLSEFYSKEASHVFCVRISQGLLHMGKGLMTLNPIHSDRLLLNGPALGGMLVLLHSCLDLKNTILDKSHYLLYYLTCAMNPRMLITVNDDMSWRPVTVRVGQAVETVGQAGKPKRITGFQTHTTPVLLGSKERAELGTEEVLSVSSVLEGVVIIKDNPDYEPEGEEGNKKK